MSLPATSLMQSAQHVTAYVHICFWISKYEYNANDSCSTEYRCHSLLAYCHTLRFVAVNEVDMSTELNRLSWNCYTFSDSGKQPAIPVMTMSSPVGSWTSVETGMACS